MAIKLKGKEQRMAKRLKIGSKVTASHTTMTEAGEEVTRHAEKLDQVTKISLGAIKRAHGGRRGIKFLPINGGIKAVVRGNGAVQDLFLYTHVPEEVVRLLMEGFRI